MSLPGSRDDADNVAGSVLAEPLLTPKDAANLLAVRPSWIYEAVRNGTLPHIKVGKHIRLLRNDLEQLVREQRQSA